MIKNAHIPAGASVFCLFSALILSLACLFGLSACFGTSKAPAVAATVNGEAIYESDVTDFIEGFRRKNTQYESDVAWAEFLRSNGYTSETMRSFVINTVFIPKTLIRQECAERGIQINDADLDLVIEREKEFYENRYGENSWDSVLASFGYDARSWRENEVDRLLEEELRNVVITDAEPTPDEIQFAADQSAASYNGKSTYYLQFPSEHEARIARDALPATTTLEGFSILGQPMYAGWNSITDNRKSMSKEYIQASNALNAHEISQPIESEGVWLLIFCDAVFNAEYNGDDIDLAKIPAEIYTDIVTEATNAKIDRLFNEWIKELAAESSISINPIPDGLPYSVNVTITDPE